MYIEDRLFSENTEEILYSILLDEDEYALYSEFCSLFSKDEDEDGINKEDLAKAAAIAAGATGAGAGVGKALQVRGQKKLKGLIGKRALQGAGIGAVTESGILSALESDKIRRMNKVTDFANNTFKSLGETVGLGKEVGRIPRVNVAEAVGRTAAIGAVDGGASGAGIGAIEGLIEKHLKEKQLKKLVKKGGKAGLAAGALASTGYLAHKASKKKKKN